MPTACSHSSGQWAAMCMQVRIFYPEVGHPAFGAVRAIVKDSTDNETGAASLVFLDSDNQVSLLYRMPFGLPTCITIIWGAQSSIDVSLLYHRMPRGDHGHGHHHDGHDVRALPASCC